MVDRVVGFFGFGGDSQLFPGFWFRAAGFKASLIWFMRPNTAWAERFFLCFLLVRGKLFLRMCCRANIPLCGCMQGLGLELFLFLPRIWSGLVSKRMGTLNGGFSNRKPESWLVLKQHDA